LAFIFILVFFNSVAMCIAELEVLDFQFAT